MKTEGDYNFLILPSIPVTGSFSEPAVIRVLYWAYGFTFKVTGTPPSDPGPPASHSCSRITFFLSLTFSICSGFIFLHRGSLR